MLNILKMYLPYNVDYEIAPGKGEKKCIIWAESEKDGVYAQCTVFKCGIRSSFEKILKQHVYISGLKLGQKPCLETSS